MILRRGDTTVGNPHRTQISQFELFELFPSLNLESEAHAGSKRGGVRQQPEARPHPPTEYIYLSLSLYLDLSRSLSLSLYTYNIYIYDYSHSRSDSTTVTVRVIVLRWKRFTSLLPSPPPPGNACHQATVCFPAAFRCFLPPREILKSGAGMISLTVDGIYGDNNDSKFMISLRHW